MRSSRTGLGRQSALMSIVGTTALGPSVAAMLAVSLFALPPARGVAIDCVSAPGAENYTGVRYDAVLIEQELSETEWLIIFGGNSFTYDGGYEPHFVDLMVKASWSQVHDDGLCASGFPPPDETLDLFGFEIGLSDYEDGSGNWDNDIGMWPQDPALFPRRFTNIDSFDPQAADKIMAEYQVYEGGDLYGKQIHVELVRQEETTLSPSINYYKDPDNGCAPNSQDNILYRRWTVTFEVPSDGTSSVVDLYVNASQAAAIAYNGALNFLWENPGAASVETDQFKVIYYNIEFRTPDGNWIPARRYLVDWRTPVAELPTDAQGRLIGGFRKTYYGAKPAIEASFGYGVTDYVADGDPEGYDPEETKGVIDLSVGIADFLLFAPCMSGPHDSANWVMPSQECRDRFDSDADDDIDLADFVVFQRTFTGTVPSICDTDCNGNQIADEIDITAGLSDDCNANGIPDECEIGDDPLLVLRDAFCDTQDVNGLRYESYADNRPGGIPGPGQEQVSPLVYSGTMSLGAGSATFTGPTYTDPTEFFPNMQYELERDFVWSHPGSSSPSGAMSMGAAITYIVPTTETYSIVGDFARANDARYAGNGVDVLVFVNTDSETPLFSASISSNHEVDADDPFGGTSVSHFDLSTDLTSGDELRFVVFPGAPGSLDIGFDATALRFAIGVDRDVDDNGIPDECEGGD